MGGSAGCCPGSLTAPLLPWGLRARQRALPHPRAGSRLAGCRERRRAACCRRSAQLAPASPRCAEVRYVAVEDIRREMEQRPEEFTVWFREELASLGYFQR